MQKPIKIFWTGGWDSTYRIVELVLQGRTVSPVYVIDRNRKSWQKEIETLESLKETINKTLTRGGCTGYKLCRIG